jgi:hypothetical protein
MGRTNTLLVTFLCLGAALPLAAQSTQPQSLGDVARQLRAQKERDAKTTTKVITNDNLPAPIPGEAITILPATPANPSTPAATDSKPATPSSETSKDKPESKEVKPRTREEWQAKFKAARQDLAKAKEMQQLSEDELNLLQIEQARELHPDAPDADLTAKVQTKQSEVNVNQATTKDAQKALDDLEKEFKDSGAPDDWSNTD